jgi:hypothetical protein
MLLTTSSNSLKARKIKTTEQLIKPSSRANFSQLAEGCPEGHQGYWKGTRLTHRSCNGRVRLWNRFDDPFSDSRSHFRGQGERKPVVCVELSAIKRGEGWRGVSLSYALGLQLSVLGFVLLSPNQLPAFFCRLINQLGVSTCCRGLQLLPDCCYGIK